jgi:hypothetical protein
VRRGEKKEHQFENYLRQAGLGPAAEEKIPLTSTASLEFGEQVKRMRQLLSGKYLRGAKLEEIFLEAMDCYIRHNCPVEKARRSLARRQAAKQAGKGGQGGGEDRRSRAIPVDTRLEVYLRGGCRCTYVGIQIDHIQPYALGGGCGPEPLRLLCRQHNLLEAERYFGHEHMQRFRRAG